MKHCKEIPLEFPKHLLMKHSNENHVQKWPKDQINLQMINSNTNIISTKKYVEMKENVCYSASILLFCFPNSLTIKSGEKVTFDHFFLCQGTWVICNNVFKWNLTNLSVHCYCLSALTSATSALEGMLYAQFTAEQIVLPALTAREIFPQQIWMLYLQIWCFKSQPIIIKCGWFETHE